MSDFQTEGDLPLFQGRNIRPTSLDAYRSADHRSNRERCFESVRSCGSAGATNDEISLDTGLPIQSVTPATGALRKAGLIRESGRTRPTRSGRAAMVYVAETEVV